MAIRSKCLLRAAQTGLLVDCSLFRQIGALWPRNWMPVSRGARVEPARNRHVHRLGERHTQRFESLTFEEVCHD